MGKIQDNKIFMPDLEVILSSKLDESVHKKYDTPEKFYNSVRAYMDLCHLNSREVMTKKGVQFIEKPFTVSGLCVHLGITRQKFSALSRKEGYKELCEYINLIAENYLEENMLNGKLNPISSIFALKNNFGWKEQKEEKKEQDIVVNIVATRKEEVAEIIDDAETIKTIESCGLNFDAPDGEE